VADEDVVFNDNALADERMARYFAPPADDRILLDFDEGSNPGIVTDLTTVQVDESREPDIRAQLYVVGDAVPGIHSDTSVPF
jgi:hypothetical protein